MNVVIDVGANDGWDSVGLASQYGLPVHAFEPAPAMLEILRDMDPRVTVVPAAVADFDGTATFHIDRHGDQGCSSLLEYAPETGPYWQGREFGVSECLEVPVVRLDTYLRANDIDEVEYLHVDAQGADLAVLEGLGDCAAMVKAGRVEAATIREVALYRDQPLVDDIEAWLAAHGFVVVAREANDPSGNEVNVEFAR